MLNTGALAWAPGIVDLQWPMIRLSYHLLHADGTSFDPNGTRTVVPHEVVPGGKVLLNVEVVCPSVPGKYLIEWDMLNETECWFSQCGSACVRTPLTVE